MNADAKKRKPYSHFLGVLLPDSVVEIVERCRSWMGEHYGCRAGYRTQPHVTLVAPFAVPEGQDISLLVETLAVRTRSLQAFEGRLAGFGAFDERTVYARIAGDSRWALWHDELRSALVAACPGAIAEKRQPFTPHLTVANRDIPAGAVAPALRHFETLNLAESFPVDHVALFEWQDGRWLVRCRWQAD